MDKSVFADKVIDYWRKIEFLGQAEVPVETTGNKESNKKARNGVKDKYGKDLQIKKIILYHGLTEAVDISQFLAKDEQEYLLYPVTGDDLYYCFGSIEREKCTAVIAKLIGEDSELRPEKESDRIAWFSFKTSMAGGYKSGSLSISPVLWVIDVLNKQNTDLGEAISLKDYRKVVKYFEDKFFNKETTSINDISKFYKEFYHTYIQPYFKEEPYEMDGKLIYYRYCSYDEKEKEQYETDYSCLWKSFIFDDLSLVQQEIREGRFGNSAYEDRILDYILAPYADRVMSDSRIDISPKSEVESLKQFFRENLDIRKAPLGKWPSKYMPALMQQVAVNLFTSDENCRVFSVNGPPGTGKTTMLKEIIVNNIVERARLFAEDKNEDADDMFERCRFEYGDVAGSNGYDKYAPYYYKLKNDKINDYGILVASCNNAAVENITKELPEGKSIINSLKADKNDCDEVAAGLEEVQELFRVEFAENIKEDDDRDIYFTKYAGEMTGMPDAWGMISAPLGKRNNIQQYCDVVLNPFLKNNKTEKKSIHKQKYLEAKENFSRQLAKVEFMRKEMEILCDYEMELSHTLSSEQYDLKIAYHNRELQKKSEEYNNICYNIEVFKSKSFALKDMISKIEKEIMALEDSRSWKDRINAFFGKKTTWNEKMEQKKGEYEEKIQELKKLESIIKEYEAFIREKTDEVDQCKKDIERIVTERTKIETMRKFQQERLKQLSHGDQAMIPFDDEFMQMYLSNNKAESTEAQVSNLWFTQQYNREREKLFYYACILNKEFVLSSKCCMHNIKNLLIVWKNNRDVRCIMDWRDREKAFPVLLQTVFLLTPVISTTFASVQRFLKEIKTPGMLGTLIIDEAGQASPQMALGAMFRCRKCIVVGDPKQIEPVVTDEVDMLRKIIAQKELSPYRNKANSVQIFADQMNPYGTYLGEDTERIWIGCPLVVHRRCISPMYDIANAISYNHTMKQKTLLPKPEKVKNFCYENSCWIDVKGHEKDTEAKNHYVEKQGKIVLQILEKAFSVSDNPDLFIISPFTSVVREMISEIKESDFVARYGSKDNKVLKWLNNKEKKRIGTVHTFQGKEADEVVFLLGCDRNAAGAVRWVNSNIVNVAATRAKYRVYFIGDKDVWANSSVVNQARKIIANEIDGESETKCNLQESVKQEEKSSERERKQYPYTEVQLLTPIEDFFFQSVKELCKSEGLVLCPKVRMEDFVWADWKKYNLDWAQEQTARNYIKSRHIDFLICNEDLQVQGGIELDDTSHNNLKAQKNDHIKDSVYQEMNFHCFRIKVQLYDDIDREGSMKWVRGYYQEEMKAIINRIKEEPHYCTVQRESRK